MFFPFLSYSKVEFMVDLHHSKRIPAKEKEKFHLSHLQLHISTGKGSAAFHWGRDWVIRGIYRTIVLDKKEGILMLYKPIQILLETVPAVQLKVQHNVALYSWLLNLREKYLSWTDIWIHLLSNCI